MNHPTVVHGTFGEGHTIELSYKPRAWDKVFVTIDGIRKSFKLTDSPFFDLMDLMKPTKTEGRLDMGFVYLERDLKKHLDSVRALFRKVFEGTHIGVL